MVPSWIFLYEESMYVEWKDVKKQILYYKILKYYAGLPLSPPYNEGSDEKVWLCPCTKQPSSSLLGHIIFSGSERGAVFRFGLLALSSHCFPDSYVHCTYLQGRRKVQKSRGGVAVVLKPGPYEEKSFAFIPVKIWGRGQLDHLFRQFWLSGSHRVRGHSSAKSSGMASDDVAPNKGKSMHRFLNVWSLKFQIIQIWALSLKTMIADWSRTSKTIKRVGINWLGVIFISFICNFGEF